MKATVNVLCYKSKTLKNGEWKIRLDLTPLAKVMLTLKNYLFLTL